MLLSNFIFFLGLLVVARSLTIITRAEWGANPPTSVTPMSNPVPYTIIHHSESPGACYTVADCSAAMRSMQDYHQNVNGWADIGYSFGVGSDGNAYEGRGWSTVGAHAPNYNSISIGICLIGNWMTEVAPANQLATVQELIQYGVDNGYIESTYGLLGHRQVRETDCPGDALYAEITGWDHWIANP